MLHPIFRLAALGVVGFALWKVLSILLLPLAGAFLGLLFTLVKVALLVGLGFFVFWLLTRRKDHDKPGEEPTSP